MDDARELRREDGENILLVSFSTEGLRRQKFDKERKNNFFAALNMKTSHIFLAGRPLIISSLAQQSLSA